MADSTIHKVSSKFVIDLHPCKTATALEGVREQLDQLLLRCAPALSPARIHSFAFTLADAGRYSETYHGVVLAYSNEKILSSKAPILEYFPYCRVQVTAEVVVFRPTAGYLLVGQVNKVHSDYIGLLMLGVFNASIAAANIRKEFKYSEMDGCWRSSKVRKGQEQTIAVGSYLCFMVEGVQERAGFFSVLGSLADKRTGVVGGPDPRDAEVELMGITPGAAADVSATPAAEPETKKKKKNKREAPPADTDPEAPTLNGKADGGAEKPHRKKHKGGGLAAGHDAAAPPANGGKAAHPPKQAPLHSGVSHHPNSPGAANGAVAGGQQAAKRPKQPTQKEVEAAAVVMDADAPGSKKAAKKRKHAASEGLEAGGPADAAGQVSSSHVATTSKRHKGATAAATAVVQQDTDTPTAGKTAKKHKEAAAAVEQQGTDAAPTTAGKATKKHRQATTAASAVEQQDTDALTAGKATKKHKEVTAAAASAVEQQDADAPTTAGKTAKKHKKDKAALVDAGAASSRSPADPLSVRPAPDPSQPDGARMPKKHNGKEGDTPVGSLLSSVPKKQKSGAGAPVSVAPLPTQTSKGGRGEGGRTDGQMGDPAGKSATSKKHAGRTEGAR